MRNDVLLCHDYSEILRFEIQVRHVVSTVLNAYRHTAAVGLRDDDIRNDFRPDCNARMTRG